MGQNSEKPVGSVGLSPFLIFSTFEVQTSLEVLRPGCPSESPGSLKTKIPPDLTSDQLNQNLWGRSRAGNQDVFKVLQMILN